MFKDYEKYLSTSLKVYLFVLVIIFIMKMVGLDYFGIDLNNSILLQINNFVLKWKLNYVYYFVSLYIQFYFYLCITCQKRNLYFYTLIGTIINMTSQLVIYKISNNPNLIYYPINFSIMIIIPMIIMRKVKILRQIKSILLMTLYQLVSIIIRNPNIQYDNWNLVLDIILNVDQIILLGITYKIYFMKGEEKLCGLEAGLSSLKKLNLKNLLTKLQKNWRNFKKQDKVTKLTYIIYFILSLIWNTLSIVLILFVAMLNDTFIECIFILTSFWLSKKSFGKAFHFSSMAKCFIVSNLSYYILNRITTPLGISIIVPILLGVGLSYVTSKFVKKPYKPLYRGMPEELFEETILKIVDKDSVKYNICYDFYIKNKSIVALSIKYNYTESGIRKIKDRVNEKIKRL